MPRKWEALASIKDFLDTTLQGLEKYSTKGKERLITAASNINDNIRKNWKTWKQKTKEKQLYEYFKR